MLLRKSAFAVVVVLLVAGCMKPADAPAVATDGTDSKVLVTGASAELANQPVANQPPAVLPVSADAAGSACRLRGSEYATRMINAERTDAASWPGFASLVFVSPDAKRTVFHCGGVLVNGTTVVTAAHCFTETRSDGGRVLSTLKASGPSDMLRQEGYRLAVVANHESVAQDSATARRWATSVTSFKDPATGKTYTAGSDGNFFDIAVVKLEAALPGPYATLAGALEANPRFSGHWLWAAGLGKTQYGAPRQYGTSYGTAVAGAGSLLEAILPLRDKDDCKSVLNSAYDDNTQICAGWETQQRDTCGGDSGGPLVVLDSRNCPVVVGLTSYGKTQCGGNAAYGVYTRVSAYSDWIKSQAGADVKFSTETPSPIGPEDTTKFVDALMERFGSGSDTLKVKMGPAFGQEFVTDAEGYRVKRNDAVVFTLDLPAGVSGKVLIYNRSENGRYQPLYPSKSMTREEAEKPVTGGAPIRIDRNIKAVLREAQQQEKNDVVVLVLPPSVQLSRLIHFDELVTKGLGEEDAAPSAYTEAAYVTALLTQAGIDPAAPKVLVRQFPYVIRKVP